MSYQLESGKGFGAGEGELRGFLGALKMTGSSGAFAFPDSIYISG
jgi:hypothetical protein